MDKKRIISLLTVFLLVLSLFVIAEEETSEKSSCSSFFGSISCFFWGNPENRAGRGWWEGRRNVVGEAVTPGTWSCSATTCTCYDGVCGDDEGRPYDFNDIRSFFDTSKAVNPPPGLRQITLGGIEYLIFKNSNGQWELREKNIPIATITGWVTPDPGQQLIIESLANPPPTSSSSTPIRNRGSPSTSPSSATPQAASAAPSPELTSPIITDQNQLKIPQNLVNQLQEGTIISSTSGAKFTVENGQWKQIERARNSQENVNSLQIEQSELTVLNDLKYYEGQNKKFTLTPPAAVQDQARLDLGQTVYDRVKSNIDWYQTLKAENIDNKNYIVPNTGLDVKNNDDGTTSVTLRVYSANNQLDKEKTQTYTVVDGQDIFIQSEAQKEKGIVKLADSKRDVYVGKLDTKDLKKGITYYENEQSFKDKDPLGQEEVKEGVITNTNFKEGTQKITNTQTGETQDLTGSYDKEDNQFTARGGEYVDASGTHYGIDYDYSGSGKEQKLEGREIYDRNGRFAGIMQKDGTVVIAQKDSKGGYSGEYLIQGADGRIITAKLEGDKFVPTSDNRVISIDNHLTIAKEELKEAIKADVEADNTNTGVKDEAARQRLKAASENVDKLNQELTKAKEEGDKIIQENTPAVQEIKNSITGWQRAQTTVESIYALTRSVRDYPALTRLFGLPNWQTEMDKQFAPLLGTNWFPSAICEGHYDIEPEGFASIKTVSGTYQAVAGIQMERSATTSPILCQRNPDTAAEEQFICDQGYVCVDEGFCHVDEDEDGEADDDTPALGYFYKITWGVTAPRDEAFTPLLDENGVAVSFNVWLDKTPDGKVQMDAPNGIYMYSREGDITSPIKLRNGENDKDVIIHYSPNLYEEACIHWDQAPSSSGDPGAGDIATFGVTRPFRDVGSSIDDVCFTVDVSSIGQVNWERAGQPQSVTVQAGEVQRNGRW